ncbi:hypothetical protein KIN20_009088 [Parelaphostrongylus tenuis]|uniref:Uncharacterized protein n=1 Tax=Parelaphostrongylus tenuis TaxID=148309 RepID=A0AAD5MNM8_PARTN|nr:hypothetical protein KIN20_009088 [Parelaphostrongylus tenuis]
MRLAPDASHTDSTIAQTTTINVYCATKKRPKNMFVSAQLVKANHPSKDLNVTNHNPCTVITWALEEKKRVKRLFTPENLYLRSTFSSEYIRSEQTSYLKKDNAVEDVRRRLRE